MGSSPSPLVIGHRGASGYRPEHTEAAYRLAFALGADAVEPDIVATRDGVLVIRHENEISTTTDIADHPEFADRRITKIVDGIERTGWFTEDFTWAELSTLRARERLGTLRQASSTFDDRYPILRLAELFEIADAASVAADRPLGIVAEIKHPSYFAGIGLPLDELFAGELDDSGWDEDLLTVECFEKSALSRVRAHGIRSQRVYLIERSGAPYDRVASAGSAAVDYAHDITERGLYELATAPTGERVDGISVNASLLIETDAAGAATGVTDVVDNAHAAGLGVFCWTLRAENRFLAPNFRRGGRDADYGDWRGQFGLLLGAGVDGVFADQPDLAVAARDHA